MQSTSGGVTQVQLTAESVTESVLPTGILKPSKVQKREQGPEMSEIGNEIIAIGEWMENDFIHAITRKSSVFPEEWLNSI